MYSIKDSVAQWIRRWSTKPEILGSIPSGVVINTLFFIVFLPEKNSSPWTAAHEARAQEQEPMASSERTRNRSMDQGKWTKPMDKSP